MVIEESFHLRSEHTAMVPEYYIENGFRYVKPYYHLHNTSSKGRWYNRTVADVLGEEFKTFTTAEYVSRIKEGSIWVERRIKRGLDESKLSTTVLKGTKFPPTQVSEGYKQIHTDDLTDLKLIDGDRVFRWDHKHERPIRAASLFAGENVMRIKIIQETKDVVVVSKPPFIPVHPVQKYYYNSLVEIMKAEAAKFGRDDWKDLRPCHRLDKLTSGLCLFAKNTQSASQIQSDIQNDKVSKTYVARVTGKLPKDTIMCKDPVLNIDAKKGKGGTTLKTAATQFTCLYYDKELDESVIQCKPITGRTHQIRIHLRNLGCPIKGDPIYSGNGPRSDPTLELETIHKSVGGKVACSEQLLSQLQMRQQGNVELLKTGELCEECHAPLFKDDNGEQHVEMCLHAIKYEHYKNEWQYEDEMPEWAKIDV